MATTGPSSTPVRPTTQEPPDAPVRPVQLATLTTTDAGGGPTRRVKRKLPDESRVLWAGRTDDDGPTVPTGGAVVLPLTPRAPHAPTTAAAADAMDAMDAMDARTSCCTPRSTRTTPTRAPDGAEDEERRG